MAPRREITLRSNRLWLDDEGIVRCEGLPGVAQTKADAEEALDAIRDLAGHRRVLVLVDIRRISSVDRGARLHYASPEQKRWTRAGGLLVGSPLSRAIGNFFLGLNKLPIPFRLFSSEAEALCWLRGFPVEAERWPEALDQTWPR